eukprot:9714875-Alexandrium_andersonii.AAC.1
MRSASASQSALSAVALKRCRSPGATGAAKYSTIPRGPARTAPVPQGGASVATVHTVGAKRERAWE